MSLWGCAGVEWVLRVLGGGVPYEFVAVCLMLCSKPCDVSPTGITRCLAHRWFVSRTCTDLALLLEDGALDMRSLANVSYMWNQPHMRYSLAVETACTYVNHRSMIAQHGSVVSGEGPRLLHVWFEPAVRESLQRLNM